MERDKINVMDLRSSTGKGGGPEKTILNSPIYIDRSRYQLLIVYLKNKPDNTFKVAEKARDLGWIIFLLLKKIVNLTGKQWVK